MRFVEKGLKSVQKMKFEVLSVGLWVGGVTEASELPLITDKNVSEAVPKGESIEKRTRRRATLLSRAAAESFAQAVRSASIDAALVPTVFCSALGETPAMIELVDQVCRGAELSPMKFAVSVHSSSSTVVTISEGNRSLTTSISANFDTVAAGLFEVAAILGSGEAVAVAVFLDDHSPDQFLVPEERYGRISVTLVLKLSPGETTHKHATLSLPSPDLTSFSKGVHLFRPPSLCGLLERSPVIGALDLALALQSSAPSVVRLDRGTGSGYLVAIEPPSSAVLQEQATAQS